MQYLSTLLTNFAIAAMLATSLNVLMGYGGLLWVAQGALAGVGAYGAAYGAMHMGMNMLVAFAFGAVVASVVAAAAGALTARLRDNEFVLASFALQIVILQVIQRWTDVTRGNFGLPGVPRPTLFGETLIGPGQFAILAAVIAVVVWLLARYLLQSPFGLLLRGVRESPRSVLASGRSTFRISVTALAVGGALGGVAGGIQASHIQFITPATFDINLSILIVVYLVVGGLGNLTGAIVGALLLTLLPELVDQTDLVATKYVAPAQQILFGLVLMAFVALRPQGILRERPIIRSRVRRGDLAEPRADARGTVPDARPAARARQPAGDGVGPALRTDGLTVRFGGLVAVNDVSLTVQPGSVTALIGPNGAGKSTLLDATTGFVRTGAGRVQLRGEDITNRTPNKIASLGVARTFQDLEVYRELTAIENVLLGFPDQPGEHPLRLLLTPRKARRDWQQTQAQALAILHDVGIADSAHTPAADMSYGQQKLLVLARLIASGADILLLDEPGSGLPSDVLDRLGETLRRLTASGKTIVLVDHNMDLIMNYADHIHVLHHGRLLVSGSPDDIRTNEDVIRVYLTAGHGEQRAQAPTQQPAAT
jgi:ABC-type branched-subunit amino acid transport system ATPase component/ABC-type branched-subunit amino acid transport system permease subunit